MRRVILVLLTMVPAMLAGCSYSTDFVVVNRSDHTVDVRYRFKESPNQPPNLTATPSTIAVSQLGTRDNNHWRLLTADEYHIDQESRTVIVSLKPREALWLARMHHYIGDEDPNDVRNFPIEGITVSGENGKLNFTGDQARKNFHYVSRVLYTLTYM